MLDSISTVHCTATQVSQYAVQIQQQYLAGSLLQVISGICVLQLNGLDSAQVEEVPAVLCVTAALLRSLSLGTELLCL